MVNDIIRYLLDLFFPTRLDLNFNMRPQMSESYKRNFEEPFFGKHGKIAFWSSSIPVTEKFLICAEHMPSRLGREVHKWWQSLSWVKNELPPTDLRYYNKNFQLKVENGR